MRTSPTFYPYLTDERVSRLYSRGLEKGLISPQEEADLREYVDEYQATRHVKIHRVIKTTSDLIHWRRFLKVPYHEATIKDIHAAISAMKNGTSLKGTPFKANTKHDYVKALRAYLVWQIEAGKSSLDVTKVLKIKVPARDYETTSPEEILTEDEITRMVDVAPTARDKALIAFIYETGARVGEVGRARWGDLTPDATGIGVTIYDEKTRKLRHSRIVAYREIIALWSRECKDTSSDRPIFTDRYRNEGIEYAAMIKIIKKTALKAGITKRVHAHLFRKSRVTHMRNQGYSESVIKKMVWGNLDTKVFRSYCMLSEQDIDEELDQKAGVMPPAKKKESPLRPRVCPECGFVSAPGSEWCGKCMQPLTDDARDHREQLIQDVIQHWDVVPEAYHRMQNKS
jgi:Site-specific recombinase XerD